VIVTSVQIGPRITEAMQGGVEILPLRLLIMLTISHVLMLLAATVLSTYKSWGRTWLGRRQAAKLLRVAREPERAKWPDRLDEGRLHPVLLDEGAPHPKTNRALGSAGTGETVKDEVDRAYATSPDW
jgi:hypothetical protein